jgi:hypothetical protein
MGRNLKPPTLLPKVILVASIPLAGVLNGVNPESTLKKNLKTAPNGGKRQ